MLGGAATAKTASYVLVAADAGDAITMNNASATTITVNTGLFAAGDIVTIINLGAGVSTITAGTATVSTSGSLALAQNQGGVLRFTSASAAIFFQFATPASSGDIEGVTAGTGISGGGTSGTVTITNSMATAIDAKGDLVVGTGADAFSRLGVGANNTVLTADSAEATGLKWATPAGGGKVLQVVTATTTTSTTNTTTTFADSGLSASITPSSATSKILVLTNQTLLVVRVSSNGRIGQIRLMRNSTEISGNTSGTEMLGISVNANSGQDIRMASGFSYTYLDSPSTTSSVTYKTQIAVQASGASGETTAQFNDAKGSIVLLEIGA